MGDLDSKLLKVQIESMQEGENIRIICPFCGGGRSKEKSLSVTRNFDSGVYNCYRASCGVKGFIPLNPLALPKNTKPKEYKPKGSLSGFVKESLRDNDNVYSYLEHNWEIQPAQSRQNNIKVAGDIRFTNGDYSVFLGTGLWVELTDFNYEVWGLYTKRLLGYTWCHENKAWITKSKEVDFPYYVPIPDLNRPVNRKVAFFVEDPLSALKVSQYGYTSVALLGTHFQPNHVLELVKQKISKIVWMLDPDTWQQPDKKAKALSLAGKTGPIIKHSIEYMYNDPKDTGTAELEEICHRNSR